MTAPLPTYEQAMVDALKHLVVDTGIVTNNAAAGTNALVDSSKIWGVNIHRNRIVKIITGVGIGQEAFVQSSAANVLVIRGTWTTPVGIGAVYVILNADYEQMIRDTLGGGVNIDISAKIDEIIAALSIGLEAAVDSGTATGGSNTTLEDTNKGWALGMWGGLGDSLLQIEIAGINYLRFTNAPVNTATVITINALPGGVVVAAGCPYSIKRALNPMLPLDRGLIHNVAYLTPADIVADIVPLNTPCLFRITACFDAAGILSVQTTNAAGGGGAVVQQFNGGVALNVNSLYEFEHLVHAGDTINYQYSVNATIMTFRVQEIVGAT